MKEKQSKSPLTRIATLTLKGVKKADIFGRSVAFNFAGEETIKSTTGGFVSVMVFWVLLYMVINYSLIMFERRRSIINTNVLVNDIDNNPVRQYIGKDRYSFSVMLRDISGKIYDFDESYLRLRMDHLSITKANALDTNLNVTLTNLGLKNCYEQYIDMLGRDMADMFQGQKSRCPTSDEYYISGSAFSIDYGSIKISISKCFGNGCRPSAEIDEYIKGKTLFLGLLNYYFDSDDYEEPVKFKFEGSYNWGILPGYYLTKTVRIASNYADDKTSYLPFGRHKEYKYYSVGKVFENMVPQQQGQPLLEVTIETDSTFIKIERNVFTLTDMASLIGGLLEIYLLWGAFFAGRFTDKIYYSKLLSHLYQVVAPQQTMVWL